MGNQPRGCQGREDEGGGSLVEESAEAVRVDGGIPPGSGQPIDSGGWAIRGAEGFFRHGGGVRTLDPCGSNGRMVDRREWKFLVDAWALFVLIATTSSSFWPARNDAGNWQEMAMNVAVER